MEESKQTTPHVITVGGQRVDQTRDLGEAEKKAAKLRAKLTEAAQHDGATAPEVKVVSTLLG